MGFFSGLKKTEPTFDARRAVMTIVIAAIGADGEVDDQEVRRLRSMCARSPLFADNTSDQDDSLIRFATSTLSQLGEDAVRKAAAHLKQPLRETAFAFACEMVLADGTVGETEDRFISNLAQTLDISESIGDAIVTTTQIRLRGE